MLSLLEVSRFDVYTAKGKRVGKVSDALFAPGTTRVVGYVVQRPRLFFLFDRKDRYLAHDRVSLADRALVVTDNAAAFDSSAAKRLGVSWDDTVIWLGMPVRARSGAKMGAVRDGLFDESSGELSALGLTAGVAADVAVGVRDLPASVVDGFDGEYVVVDNTALQTETSGGAAAAAGKGAAVAKKTATDTVQTATRYTKAAAKVAAESETAKKAMGWLKALKDEVVDAMGEPDDDDK